MGPTVFRPFSKKTRKSNRFADVITNAVLSSQLFKVPDPSPSRVEPATSRSADLHSPN